MTINFKTSGLIFLLSTIFVLSLVLQGCKITETPVGDYHKNAGEESVYAKAKQLYLFGCRLGKTTVATPPEKDCLVKTKTTFGDFILTLLTAGIFSSKTIIVYEKKPLEKKNSKIQEKPNNLKLFWFI